MDAKKISAGIIMTRKDILNRVAENDIALVRFVYIDNDGVIRGYSTTADVLGSDVQNGHNLALAMPFFSVLDTLVPGSRFGCSGEITGLPDGDTFRILPYVSHSAMLICDLVEKKDHSPSGLCARSLLKDYLARLDCEVRAAFENEFYLVVRDEKGGIRPFDESLCFATSGMNRQHALVLDIIRGLQAQGITVEKYYPEYGRGQVEIVYRYDQALKTADNQVFFRETVKGVAQNHGLIASFMPKPFQDNAGSGAHLHISLFEGGQNLFYDATDSYELSQTGKYFIGGLLEHLPALCAFTAGTVNSYKRLVPRHWASAYVCWGLDNREASVRVVPGSKGSRAAGFNLEIKPVDAACNPYLALVAALAAGFDGINRQIDPGAPVAIDPDEMPAAEREQKNIKRLPHSLGAAADALAADALYQAVLGDVFRDEYIRLKRFQSARYREYVSQWELDTYLEAF